MGDLLGSLVWGVKSGQYCVIEGESLHFSPMKNVLFYRLFVDDKPREALGPFGGSASGNF
jgi:hypothetical protein